MRHEAQVYAVVAGGRGATLFTGGDDPGLRIWRSASGEPLGFVPARGNQFFTLATAGDRLAAGGNSLAVYAQDDLAASRRVFRDRAHHGWIASVAFAPDGSRIVSGGEDGRVRVWNVATRVEERVWAGHAGGVAAVRFVDGDKTVAAADDLGVLLHPR